jgi:membrane protein implicated in regulation of membrane protease activity
MIAAAVTSKGFSLLTAASGAGAIIAQAADLPAASYTFTGALILAVVGLWRALNAERRQRDQERRAFENTLRTLGRAEGRAAACPKCGDV